MTRKKETPMKILPVTAAFALALPLLAASQEKPAPAHDHGAMAAAPEAGKAVAVLTSAAGDDVAGTIWFTRAGSGVQVKAKITGLAPGTHGFHVHEFGDCSAPDFTSAGSHFNPMSQPHAGPQAEARHVGDLGNITAGADGVATVDMTDKHLAFAVHHGVIGRAVIVHAKADDLKTQPTGDAGGRLACGVIGVAKQ
jgi:Cu-Zn family superoxide dismutase